MMLFLHVDESEGPEDGACDVLSELPGYPRVSLPQTHAKSDPHHEPVQVTILVVWEPVVQ